MSKGILRGRGGRVGLGVGLRGYTVSSVEILVFVFFFFNDTATTEIYTSLFVGSVRCV